MKLNEEGVPVVAGLVEELEPTGVALVVDGRGGRVGEAKLCLL